VCGADEHVIVARNFGRFVAGGAAGHSDHGRDLIEVLEAILEGQPRKRACQLQGSGVAMQALHQAP
jgi:hydroxylamine reductase (hybrid-cluster protein)